MIKIEEFKDKVYNLVARKKVPDSDGFMTEYSWYFAPETGTHVFVFGDSDIYRPEQEIFDHVCETEDQAREWFDNYSGFKES